MRARVRRRKRQGKAKRLVSPTEVKRRKSLAQSVCQWMKLFTGSDALIALGGASEQEKEEEVVKEEIKIFYTRFHVFQNNKNSSSNHRRRGERKRTVKIGGRCSDGVPITHPKLCGGGREKREGKSKSLGKTGRKKKRSENVKRKEEGKVYREREEK